MFKENQTVTELKESIHSLVDNSHSVSLLKKVEKELKAEKKDWWNELPVEQQKRLTKALKDAKTGKNLVAHDDVMKRAKARIKQRSKK